MKLLLLACLFFAMVSYSQLQAPVYSSGEQAVFYNGANFTSIPSTAHLKMSGEYTIAAWVYPTSRTTSWARVIGKGSGRRNYGLWIWRTGSALSQSGCLVNGHNAWIQDAKPSIVPLNQWSLIVGVFKPKHYHSLYVNGQLITRLKTQGVPCQDNSPLTIGRLSPYNGFIGNIRKAQIYNYAMTEEQLDILFEKDPATNVIEMLRTLINEASQEIKSINSSVADKHKEVTNLEGALTTATQAENFAKERMNEAEENKNIAEGKKNTACGEMDKLIPGLEKEINTFNTVISTLRGLLDNKDLVENSIDVTAFISLEDQADPVKVNNVVGLVQDLVIKSQSQITSLKDACDDATSEYETAEASFLSQSSKFKIASQSRSKAEDNLNVALGALEVLEKKSEKRIEQLKSEIEALNEAISLIQSVQ